MPLACVRPWFLPSSSEGGGGSPRYLAFIREQYGPGVCEVEEHHKREDISGVDVCEGVSHQQREEVVLLDVCDEIAESGERR